MTHYKEYLKLEIEMLQINIKLNMLLMAIMKDNEEYKEYEDIVQNSIKILNELKEELKRIEMK